MIDRVEEAQRFVITTQQAYSLYDRLYTTYGAQGWWPAESSFEIIVGALLTQNTAWHNVERAITNLKHADVLHCNALLALPQSALAELIRPAGCFNTKAKRLSNFFLAYKKAGGFAFLAKKKTGDLRQWLLAINGVGPETATSILLYVFERSVFVIDTYTRRLFKRLGWIEGSESYDDLRLAMETALGRASASLYGEYHALVVCHGKRRCDGTLECRHCYIEKPL